jgi:hypothetical protein
LPPRIGRWIAWLAWVGVLGAVLIVRTEELDCTAAASASAGNALSICQREYQRTHNPATGAWIAGTLQGNGELDGAEVLARELIPTAQRADAFAILGSISSDRKHYDDAISAFEMARKLHLIEHAPVDVARDNRSLAEALFRTNQYAPALRALDDCLTASREGTSPAFRQIEFYCHLAAQKVLTRVGYFDLGIKELEDARPLATSDMDLMWLEKERGDVEQERVRDQPDAPHDERAILAFENALALNASAKVPNETLSLELNLAYSSAEAGHIDDANRHLEQARQLDSKHALDADVTRIAGRIAYRRRDRSSASSLNEAAYQMIAADQTKGDYRLEIASLQARIKLEQQDFTGAALSALRGIAEVERIRIAQSPVELRPWIQSSRREPYELRFAALARAALAGTGPIEDALMALAQWQGRTMLDTMARPKPGLSLALRDVANRTEKLGPWLAAISSAPFAKPADRTAVLTTLGTIDLLVLVVADGHVWRLSARHGRFGIKDLGSRRALQNKVDALKLALGDLALATEVGDHVLPEDTFDHPGETLHVLLDGSIAGWPLPAFGRNRQRLAAVRPIMRVHRLPETPCITPVRSGHNTVLGDSSGDLPEAEREAREVALRLHTTAMLGTAATSTALFAATGDSVLHLALHAHIDTSGSTLPLADRQVYAPEISARGLGPSLVVLLACNSAQAMDAEQAGSLATAFLAAGSTQVVATLRDIQDLRTPELASRFYAAGGVQDPVRALAKVQAELSEPGANNGDWPYFAVFGDDICRTTR